MEFKRAFSLVELMVSMIVISILIAAFMPIVTKRMKAHSLAVKMSGGLKLKCEGDCRVCYRNGCLVCEKNCAYNQTKITNECICKDCSSLFSNCERCNTSKCTKCMNGYYLNGLNCESCPAGYTCDGTIKHECPAGTYSSSTSNTCTPCTDGKTSSSASASCTVCPSGTYANETKTKCLDCETGSKCNSGIKTPCSSDGINKYQSKTKQSTCSACSSGYYVDPDRTTCTICPIGSQCPDGSKEELCSSIGTNKYSSTKGAKSCSTCPSGSRVNSDRTTCTKCSEGQTCTGGDGADCKAGYKKDGDKCTICPAGTYSSTQNSTTCTKCAKGSYSSSEGSTSCTKCAKGSYSSSEGSTSCTKCDANTYSSTSGASSCSNCDKGKYSPEGSSSCTTCPTGCSACTDKDTCTECKDGYYLSTINHCNPAPENFTWIKETNSFVSKNNVGEGAPFDKTTIKNYIGSNCVYKAGTNSQKSECWTKKGNVEAYYACAYGSGTNTNTTVSSSSACYTSTVCSNNAAFYICYSSQVEVKGSHITTKTMHNMQLPTYAEYSAIRSSWTSLNLKAESSCKNIANCPEITNVGSKSSYNICYPAWIWFFYGPDNLSEYAGDSSGNVEVHEMTDKKVAMTRAKCTILNDW